MKQFTLFFSALGLAIAIAATSCGNEKKQIDALVGETERIHDEAMKEMADMNRIARDLKQRMIADSNMAAERKDAIMSVLTQMGKAENDMMDWMKNYKNPDGMPPAEGLKYIQEQKDLIEKNQKDIKAALEAGQKLQ
jgi:hypothetical protein